MAKNYLYMSHRLLQQALKHKLFLKHKQSHKI